MAFIARIQIPNCVVTIAVISAEFREKVFEACQAMQIEPDYLMACMALETAATFRPDIKNMAGSGATGLVQFMPATARGVAGVDAGSFRGDVGRLA